MALVQFSNDFGASPNYLSAHKIFKNVHKGKLTQNEAIEKLKGILVDYSLPNQRDASLNRFVRDCTGLQDFSIDEVDNERGWSGNATFWIRDPITKAKLFFLKIFKTEAKQFIPEMYGLQLLQRITGISSPTIKALGQIQDDKDHAFVVLETLASGFSFQHYYNEVNKYPKDSKDRDKVIETLIEGAKICGRGLANLHQHKKGERKTLDGNIKQSVLKDLDKAKLKLTSKPEEGIDIERLVSCAKKVIDDVEKELYWASLTHGDVKLIHAYYNSLSKEFSLIDPEYVSKSLDSNGNVQGMPAMDYYQFVLSLILNRYGYSVDVEEKVLRKELLTEQETKTVIESYKTGYIEAGGELPTKAQEDFLLLRHDLGFVGSHVDKLNQLQEPNQTRLKALIEISLENLKNRIKKMDQV